MPGAHVNENIKVSGKSGRKRQLDVQVFLPMKVELSKAISVSVDIHIIVDAKKHERPVDIELVGQIDDLRDDVGAHLVIIASPIGFTDSERMVWTDDGEFLRLTQDGIEDYESFILPAEDAPQ